MKIIPLAVAFAALTSPVFAQAPVNVPQLNLPAAPLSCPAALKNWTRPFVPEASSPVSNYYAWWLPLRAAYGPQDVSLKSLAIWWGGIGRRRGYEDEDRGCDSKNRDENKIIADFNSRFPDAGLSQTTSMQEDIVDHNPKDSQQDTDNFCQTSLHLNSTKYEFVTAIFATPMKALHTGTADRSISDNGNPPNCGDLSDPASGVVYSDAGKKALGFWGPATVFRTCVFVAPANCPSNPQ